MKVSQQQLWQKGHWFRSRKLVYQVSIAVVLLWLLHWIFKIIRPPPPAAIQNPFEALYHHNESCQETKILPFEVGCPESCRSWWQHDDNNNNSDSQEKQTYYRITLEWYFGQPPLQNTTTPVAGSYYQKGKNYESVSPDFIDAFAHSSDELETKMKETDYNQSAFHNPPFNLTIKRQKFMHLSLLYLCCLTQEEAYHTQALLRQYIKYQHPVSIPVTFDRVECWRERGNSVTNIVVADNASQVRINQEYEKVVAALKGEGVPVVVPRIEQMPFHVTLMGLNYGNSQADWEAGHRNIISPLLPRVYDILQDINQQYWQESQPHFVVAHDAQFSAKPERHTRPTIYP